YGGTCYDVYRACGRGLHAFLCSPPLLSETKRILTDKFKMPRELVERSAAAITGVAIMVEPVELPRSTCRDPDDRVVLGTAESGLADLIVTGDSHLLELRVFGKARIVRPADSLRLLSEQSGSIEPSGGGVAAERRVRYRRRLRR
ncbi:MAG: putative toxin-antitoxin system toxin component, PIN family, partial [bacterium]